VSFKKPFRAVPIKLGERYRREERTSERNAAIKFLSLAAVVGATVGVGTIAIDKNGRAGIASAIKPLAVRAGLARAREPQPGDYWGGCNDARAAGTAPIYAGEPGYRETMDGDGDGVACEPYH
jgi:hypothetical protein